MQKLVLFIVFGSFSYLLDAQTSIVQYYDSYVAIEKDSNAYRISHKENGKRFENLNFARIIVHYFQILDNENNMFYLDQDLNVLDDITETIDGCGIYSRYRRSVEPTRKKFVIKELEEFHTAHPEVTTTTSTLEEIPKSMADKVYFINGEDNLYIEDSFCSAVNGVSPKMLILEKKGKYFTLENPNTTYDSISFVNYCRPLKTKINDLYGLLGHTCVQPKYKHISDFDFFLAKAELPNNETVYIDIDGNEYHSNPSKK
ncbi:hypothetical protein J0X14_05110 [Muricauda sp. CAU 1633]|uniref:hypothetical protein n=1 Tax=Allomuricauda sp. CAU 1633 TaxID=2816036 RepID=UPI001A8EC741|nr:hypothetical protein [Muricauda sp. CAU 1633]MBO0321665.1 hypothetical protein [Muricauda sp. CAU 1633]